MDDRRRRRSWMTAVMLVVTTVVLGATASEAPRTWHEETSGLIVFAAGETRVDMPVEVVLEGFPPTAETEFRADVTALTWPAAPRRPEVSAQVVDGMMRVELTSTTTSWVVAAWELALHVEVPFSEDAYGDVDPDAEPGQETVVLTVTPPDAALPPTVLGAAAVSGRQSWSAVLDIPAPVDPSDAILLTVPLDVGAEITGWVDGTLPIERVLHTGDAQPLPLPDRCRRGPCSATIELTGEVEPPSAWWDADGRWRRTLGVVAWAVVVPRGPDVTSPGLTIPTTVPAETLTIGEGGTGAPSGSSSSCSPAGGGLGCQGGALGSHPEPTEVAVRVDVPAALADAATDQPSRGLLLEISPSTGSRLSDPVVVDDQGTTEVSDGYFLGVARAWVCAGRTAGVPCAVTITMTDHAPAGTLQQLDIAVVAPLGMPRSVPDPTVALVSD